MKRITVFLVLVVVSCIFSPTLYAEEGHEHEHKVAEGPKGGRLLEGTEPQAEFYVETDDSATVTFYDHDLKPVPVQDQSVLVIANTSEGKSQIDFEKKDNALTSKGKLPEGEDVNLVVQVKQTTDARPLNFRFALQKGICGMCKRAEYACICEH